MRLWATAGGTSIFGMLRSGSSCLPIANLPATDGCGTTANSSALPPASAAWLRRKPILFSASRASIGLRSTNFFATDGSCGLACSSALSRSSWVSAFDPASMLWRKASLGPTAARGASMPEAAASIPVPPASSESRTASWAGSGPCVTPVGNAPVGSAPWSTGVTACWPRINPAGASAPGVRYEVVALVRSDVSLTYAAIFAMASSAVLASDSPLRYCSRAAESSGRGADSAPPAMPWTVPPNAPSAAALPACFRASGANGSLPLPHSSASVWPYSVPASAGIAIAPLTRPRAARPLNPVISPMFFENGSLPVMALRPSLSPANSSDPASIVAPNACASSLPVRLRFSLTDFSARSPPISPPSMPNAAAPIAAVWPTCDATFLTASFCASSIAIPAVAFDDKIFAVSRSTDCFRYDSAAVLSAAFPIRLPAPAVPSI